MPPTVLLTGSSGLVGRVVRRRLEAGGHAVRPFDVAGIAGDESGGGDAPADRHVRLTLCGPGPSDTSAARRILDWHPTRSWPPPDVG
jgi:hypothetical protein